MIQREIESWDGTSLFYELSGREVGSAPAAVLCDGIGCDGFVWKYLRPVLDERFTVLHGHYRGHGRSGRAADPGAYAMADNVRDVLALMDHAGVEDAVLLGHSMGVQVCLEAALSAPERVTGLVLMCGSFGRPLDTWHDHSMLKAVLPGARRVVDRFGGLLRPVVRRLLPTSIGWYVAQTEVDGKALRREDFIPYLRHLAHMDQAVFLQMLSEAARHTTEDRLGSVEQPALVIGGERDKFTPFWVSEVMGERLPRAELHMVRSGTHTAPLEHRKLTEMLIGEWLERYGLHAERVGRRGSGSEPAGQPRSSS